MAVAERDLVELTPAERMREEVTAWDSIFRQMFRLPPYNPDDLLTSRNIDLYDTMMQDAQVRASINTKRYALLARPWQVFSSVREAAHPDFCRACEARDFVENALRSLKGSDGGLRDFRNIL